MISFDQVTKIYREPDVVLRDLSFDLAQGEFAVLTGSSGAGKTTLLQLITCETRPTRGRVLVGGFDVSALSWRKIPQVRRQIGVVFQDFRLLPRRTVAENVGFVLRALAWPGARRKERVRRVLEWVGLLHRANDWPEMLSGGEKQRVAIARALAPEPRIVLADEPTGNLDPERSREILTLMREIHARGATVLLASHDPLIVGEAGSRVLRLAGGRLVP